MNGKRPRTLNATVAAIFLVLTLALPVRGLLSTRDPAADAGMSGQVIFDRENYNSAVKSRNYILLFVFGGLTLVYAWRAFKPTASLPATAPRSPYEPPR